MSKQTLLTFVALVLAGCASSGGWRDLRVDASSQARLDESIGSFERELPYHRLQYFAIAVNEIAGSYPPEGGLERLDGLGYDEIVALGGARAKQRYLAARAGYGPRTGAPGAFWPFPDPNVGRPIFTIDGQPVPVPGGQGWPTGADARGRAEY